MYSTTMTMKEALLWIRDRLFEGDSYHKRGFSEISQLNLHEGVLTVEFIDWELVPVEYTDRNGVKRVAMDREASCNEIHEITIEG